MKSLRTCVSSDAVFIVGIHQPGFAVENLREQDYILPLGSLEDGTEVFNTVNFPESDVTEPGADRIYEIVNPFGFKGTTYINSRWAERNAVSPESISLPRAQRVSMKDALDRWSIQEGIAPFDMKQFLSQMPRSVRLAIAETSTDPEDLILLARMACDFVDGGDSEHPSGIAFKKTENGQAYPRIHDHALYECVANNPELPDHFKELMVLRPGVQGSSEIVGEWKGKAYPSHVFEYLRRNSYIPWGHFASNTAHDRVRYKTNQLSLDDMKGLRHLYYQRIYSRLAIQLGIDFDTRRKRLEVDELEALRLDILARLANGAGKELEFNGSLWGWNFGFGYAPSGYRLHASHQQIHQQYAMVPRQVRAYPQGEVNAYACGDMIADFIDDYRDKTGQHFFDTYISAIRANTRTDGKPEKSSSLVVFEDEQIMLFVPKAQTSQWELQLMTLNPNGNCLEADSRLRDSIDKGILIALQVLETMGARMVTSIEYSKRFDAIESDQHLLYAFLPKLPESPGAFSEAQLRWINGHYPEDFAQACRSNLKAITMFQKTDAPLKENRYG